MHVEIRDCTASPEVVRIYFLADSHVRKLRSDDIRSCILLIKFITVPDANK